MKKTRSKRNDHCAPIRSVYNLILCLPAFIHLKTGPGQCHKTR